MKSIQKTAKFAGILYLIVIVAAIIAYYYIPANMIAPGDAAATVDNIQMNEPLLRLGGIGSQLVILLCQIVLSIVLYVMFKPVHKTLSLVAAVSRLAMTIIQAVNLLNYYFVLLLLGGTRPMPGFEAEHIQALVALFLDAHSYGYTIGIAFLTVHVFILGFLIFRSGYFPGILGIQFLIVGLLYAVEGSAILLSGSYATPPAFIAVPTPVAEIVFPLWLLIKGVNMERWETRVLQPA